MSILKGNKILFHSQKNTKPSSMEIIEIASMRNLWFNRFAEMFSQKKIKKPNKKKNFFYCLDHRKSFNTTHVTFVVLFAENPIFEYAIFKTYEYHIIHTICYKVQGPSPEHAHAKRKNFLVWISEYLKHKQSVKMKVSTHISFKNANKKYWLLSSIN